jgi:hypothetical protein
MLEWQLIRGSLTLFSSAPSRYSLLRNFSAGAACFRESNCNRLFAAGDSLAGSAAPQGSGFPFVQGFANLLRSSFAVALHGPSEFNPPINRTWKARLTARDDL